MVEDKIEYSSLRIYGTKNAINVLRSEQDNFDFWDEVVRMKLSGKIEVPNRKRG